MNFAAVDNSLPFTIMNFAAVDNSLPFTIMNFAAVDNRIPEKVAAALLHRGFSLIRIPPHPALSEPVSAHPDMLFFIGDRLLCFRDYLAANPTTVGLLSRASGLDAEPSDEPLSALYPEDILFNAAQVGKTIFCRRKYISRAVLDYAERHCLELADVKQGYAKCSVCPVSAGALITADAGIAKAALSRGFEVLLISPQGVRLDGCSCGFIGGASGIFGDEIFFCGDLMLHPDGKSIAEFCLAHRKRPVSLSDEPLYDVGTMLFFASSPIKHHHPAENTAPGVLLTLPSDR